MEMKSKVLALTKMLTETDNPTLADINKRTNAIRNNLHVSLTIYRFVRAHQRSMMKVYTAMKKVIVGVFDYLLNRLNTEMERAPPPSDALIERIGPAVDAVNLLMPKLRSAYTKNIDDKKAYIEEYKKLYKDTALVFNTEMEKLVKKKNPGKFIKVLVLCRVIAKLEKSSYCVFSQKCKP